MDIQLALHSSPRFSTWLWIADWKILIDAGDGASQQLGYKIRKIDTVAMTHAHRDHLGGLRQGSGIYARLDPEYDESSLVLPPR